MTATPGAASVPLHTLELGQRFLFAADDLERRGPCVLVEKGMGSAIIRYEPRKVTRQFTARDRRGQPVERTITSTDSGEERCALGAEVLPL